MLVLYVSLVGKQMKMQKGREIGGNKSIPKMHTLKRHGELILPHHPRQIDQIYYTTKKVFHQMNYMHAR